MATWKKVIVSGSNISQLNNDSGYLISGDSGVELSGSFSGSFYGDGTNLTGVIAAIPNSLLLNDANSGLAGGTFSGQTAVTASLDLDNLAAATVDVANDSIAIIDATDNGTKKESIADLISGVAGAGLTANAGQLDLTNDSVTLGTTSIALGDVVTSVAGLTLTGTKATGSFTGSFFGNFVGTTDLPDLTEGAGITAFTYDGSTTATIAVSGASALTSNVVSKWSGDAFVDSSLTDNGTTVSGATSIVLTGAASSLTGSFTGSFVGDGSGLTGLVTELNVSGSDGSGISIDLLTQDLTIGGTSNEIETTVAGTTVTIGLPNDVTIGQDLTVSRNLTVLGTASFQHTTDIDVADRFIRLASGSNAAGDGGIAIQQDSATNTEVFGFDAAATRWGITGSFDPSQNAMTPDAFMAAALVGAGTDPNAVASRYDAAGNIFVGTDEAIWIYS